MLDLMLNMNMLPRNFQNILNILDHITKETQLLNILTVCI